MISPIPRSWTLLPRDPDAEQALAGALGIRPLLAALLVQRGFSEPESAAEFLDPKLSQLHDPKLLPDYAPAVKEILGARERGELIFIHGDYDVDGVTSAALLSRFLSKIDCKVHTHVPHREKEGYGINEQMVEEAVRLGAKLFLTCDCGISAIDQVKRAKEAGMRVVVTDHHTIGEHLPDAEAVVNPHRSDSKYPFSELSGAGVVFKLCAGIAEELGLPLANYYRAYLDLAALGTVADIMPLRGENRIIAKFGLEQLRDSKKAGLRALMRESRLDERAAKGLKAWDISFVLGPRLNAAGRVDDAKLALELLMATNEQQAAPLARRIEELNTQRKTEQEQIVKEAIEQVLLTGQAENPVIFVWNEKWHGGLVGIVAGKLVETFHRPAFVATVDVESGKLRGSARSIEGFHLADAVRAHSEIMTGGGHAMAAGFGAQKELSETVHGALKAYGESQLTPEMLVKRHFADVEMTPDQIDFLSVEELERMEPFGEANREPVVWLRRVPVVEVKQTKNPAHPQLVVKVGGGVAKAPAFNLGERFDGLRGGFEADLMVVPSIDEWQGVRRLQLRVRDFEVVG